LQSEDCFYHITSRGDDRKKIFISEYDFAKFLEYLSLAKTKFKFYIYGYCLMSNHYHLLLETTQPNISKIMHYINGSYTTYYNIKRRRSGHLFQGRFKSVVVDKDSYFLELSRYIHLNPVRAKIVDNPAKYRWSSYPAYLGKRDALLDRDRLKQCLDMNTSQYERFVLKGIKDLRDPFKNVYAGFLLGSVKFIKEKLENLRHQIEGDEISHKQTIARTTSKNDIIKDVIDKYHKTIEQIRISKHRPMKEKNLTVYLLRKFTSLTNKEIGLELGMKPMAVSKSALRMGQLIGQDKGLKREAEEIMSTIKV
jgi:REP element-mobilizing transposase RayT